MRISYSSYSDACFIQQYHSEWNKLLIGCFLRCDRSARRRRQRPEGVRGKLVDFRIISIFPQRIVH